MADGTTNSVANQSWTWPQYFDFVNPFSSSSVWRGSNDPRVTPLADHTWSDTWRNVFYELPVFGQTMNQFSDHEKQVMANSGFGPNFPTDAKIAEMNKQRAAKGLPPVMNKTQIQNATLNDLAKTDLGGAVNDATADDEEDSGINIGLLIFAGVVLGLLVYTFAGRGR